MGESDWDNEKDTKTPQSFQRMKYVTTFGLEFGNLHVDSAGVRPVDPVWFLLCLGCLVMALWICMQGAESVRTLCKLSVRICTVIKKACLKMEDQKKCSNKILASESPGKTGSDFIPVSDSLICRPVSSC